MLIKRKDWRERLAEAIRQSKRLPFGWGTNDCTLFTGRCVEAMTGVDLYSEHVGKYSDARGAFSIYKNLGCADLYEVCDLYFGDRLPTPKLASYGDVVIVDSGRPLFPSLGICVGPVVVSTLEESGVAFVPMECWLQAWRLERG